MENLLTKVTLEAANRKKDKSVSLRFVTQLEQSSAEFMEMDKALNQSGVLYFKPEGELTQEEVEAISSAEIKVEGKSKGQVLRNTLYVLYTQKPCSDKNKDVYLDFKEFYSNEMNRITNHYKQKLN